MVLRGPCQKHAGELIRTRNTAWFVFFFFSSAVTWEPGSIDIWELMSGFLFEKVSPLLGALNYNLYFSPVVYGGWKSWSHQQV